MHKSPFAAAVSEQVWRTKYRWSDNGHMQEPSIEASWDRWPWLSPASSRTASNDWRERFAPFWATPLSAGRPHPGRCRHHASGHAVQLLCARPAGGFDQRHLQCPARGHGHAAGPAVASVLIFPCCGRSAARPCEPAVGLGASLLPAVVGGSQQPAGGRQPAPWRDDGHAALRPPRHRGLCAVQSQTRSAGPLQPVGAGVGRLHACGRGGQALAAGVSAG